MSSRLKVGTLLFPGFELLDVFGPLEMFGLLREEVELLQFARVPGGIKSHQGPVLLAENALAEARGLDLLLVPGGLGTRREVENGRLLEELAAAAENAATVATVCTGSALLARTGLLDGKKATSNKLAWDWVISQGPRVEWVRRARWVTDGKFSSSSGISAGIDMALALIATLKGVEKAEDCARQAEYRWNRDSEDDPFA